MKAAPRRQLYSLMALSVFWPHRWCASPWPKRPRPYPRPAPHRRRGRAVREADHSGRDRDRRHRRSAVRARRRGDREQPDRVGGRRGISQGADPAGGPPHRRHPRNRRDRHVPAARVRRYPRAHRRDRPGDTGGIRLQALARAWRDHDPRPGLHERRGLVPRGPKAGAPRNKIVAPRILPTSARYRARRRWASR